MKKLLVAFVLLTLTSSALADLAWLPSVSGGTVTLIGLEPLRKVRSFAVEPPMGQRIESALVTPDNRTLLLIDSKLDRVVGVDLRDERSHWSVPVPEGPEAAWLSPDGKQLAVCAERAGKVVFIDLEQRRVAGSLRIQAPAPHDCLFSADGRWLVITRHKESAFSVIDLHSGRLQRRVVTGGEPAGMAFVGRELWLAIPGSHQVEVIEVGNWTRSATLPVGLQPVALATPADGRYVYVANRNSGTVSVIDAAQRRIIRHVPAGKAPAHLALSSDGRLLLVSSREEATALALDTLRLQPAGQVRLTDAPWGAAAARRSS
jgi:YVTN family beta-propeller protein